MGSEAHPRLAALPGGSRGAAGSRCQQPKGAIYSCLCDEQPTRRSRISGSRPAAVNQKRVGTRAAQLNLRHPWQGRTHNSPGAHIASEGQDRVRSATIEWRRRLRERRPEERESALGRPPLALAGRNTATASFPLASLPPPRVEQGHLVGSIRLLGSILKVKEAEGDERKEGKKNDPAAQQLPAARRNRAWEVEI